MLLLKNNTLYTGITNDIDNRLKKHATGKGSKYVRANKPFTLVFVEKIEGGRSEAGKREYKIKQLTKEMKEELLFAKNNICSSIPITWLIYL